MLSVSSRLLFDKTPKLNKDGTLKLKLQEAILVGNHQNQVNSFIFFINYLFLIMFNYN